MKRNLLFAFLILAGLNVLNSQTSFPFSGGDGSEENPYLIETRPQLDSLRNRLGAEHRGLHYRLVNDIDLSEARWEPIGDTIGNDFQGKLHGSGKQIQNIVVDGDYMYSGLFGVLASGAYIDSLHIADGIIKGNTAAGGIAGYVDFHNVGGIITINYCSNSACIIFTGSTDMDGLTGIGGIAGYIRGQKFGGSGQLNITFCENTGSVEGGVYSGGIFGFFDKLGGYYSGANLISCINKGDVKNKGLKTSYAGGIIGMLYGNNSNYQTNLTSCRNFGNITGEKAEVSSMSGILGSINGSRGFDSANYPIIIITGCSNYGEVMSSGADFSYAGGILGSILTHSQVDIISSENKGIIGENPNTRNSFLGGIAGYAYFEDYLSFEGGASGISINKSINYGNILSNNQDSVYIGGLLGFGEVKQNRFYIENSANYGNIYCNEGENVVIGGITGYSKSRISIKNTYNQGDIETSGTNIYLGGVIGTRFTISNKSIMVENTYSSGILTATGTNSVTGGIAGFIEDPDAVIQNSVSCSEQMSGTTVHRIIGEIPENSPVTLENNMANEAMLVNNTVVPAIHTGGSTNEGENKTINELYSQSTYENELTWDFTDIWAIRGDTTGFPYLIYQSAPVRILRITQNTILFNAWNAADSMQIFHYSTSDHLASFTNIEKGNNIQYLDLSHISEGDTLRFFMYEKEKTSSYPVWAIIAPAEEPSFTLFINNEQHHIEKPYSVPCSYEKDSLHIRLVLNEGTTVNIDTDFYYPLTNRPQQMLDFFTNTSGKIVEYIISICDYRFENLVVACSDKILREIENPGFMFTDYKWYRKTGNEMDFELSGTKKYYISDSILNQDDVYYVEFTTYEQEAIRSCPGSTADIDYFPLFTLYINGEEYSIEEPFAVSCNYDADSIHVHIALYFDMEADIDTDFYVRLDSLIQDRDFTITGESFFKDYTLQIQDYRFDNIVYTLADELLKLIENPGIVYESYNWYKKGKNASEFELVGTKDYHYESPLNPKDTYYVELVTDKGITIKSCEGNPDAAPVSIKILDASQHVKIYPNPASDVLFITCNKSFTHIEVLDINGRILLMKDYHIAKTSQNLNIQSLNKGIYIVKIVTITREQLIRKFEKK